MTLGASLFAPPALYLLGPMRACGPDYNYPAFNAAAKSLRSYGWTTHNPAEQGEPGTQSDQAFLAKDLALIAGTIALQGPERLAGMALPGWERSLGASLEVRTLHALGAKVYDYAIWDSRGVLQEIAMPAHALTPLGESLPAPVPPKAPLAHKRFLIGLAGRKGAGKDAVAAILVRDHGYVREAFADALKNEVYDAISGSGTEPLDATSREDFLAYIEKHKHDKPGSPQSWTRQILQAWGEMRRGICSSAYWINQVPLVPGVVISDVRHPNEVEAISSRGGVIIKIVRPGLDKSDPHLTEAQADTLPCDYILGNDGDLASLPRKVDAALGYLTARAQRV